MQYTHIKEKTIHRANTSSDYTIKKVSGLAS